MTDHSGATLVWQTDPPSKEQIALLREKISGNRAGLGDLDEPSKLIFCMIELSEDGPVVMLKGHKGAVPNAFDAEFYPDSSKAPKMQFSLDEYPDIEEGIEMLLEKMGLKEE